MSLGIPRRSSGELYKTLDIEKDASPDAIKKAYRKKALQLHPDKTGGTTTEAFKAVQEANAILSDPEKRKLYDTFGRSGMAKMEQYGMAGAAAGILEHPMAVRCIIGIIFLIFFLMLLWVSLVVAKLDSPKPDWTYAAIFTPIWILMVFVVPAAPFLIFNGVKERRIDTIFMGLAMIMYVVSTAFFVKVLDGHTEWATFFTVAFVNMALFYVAELISLRPSNMQEMLAAQGHPAASVEGGITFTSPIFIQNLISNLFNMGCGLAFAILLRQRLCLDKPDLSFYVVFAPLYIRSSLPLILSFVCTMREAVNVSIKERICAFVVLLFTLAAALYTTVMISVKMQKEWNELVDGPKAAVCAILFFIVLGILTLASCCGCCCVGNMMAAANGDYSDLNDAENGEAGTSAAAEEDSTTDVRGSPVPNVSTPIVAGPSGQQPEQPTSDYNSID